MSTRHPIGKLGETVISNWLSRSGFEVTIVDHTGIDIIAYSPSTKQRFGITVKSRTMTVGKEEDSVNLFLSNARQKLLDACNAFACEPWIGIYVESLESADVYLTSYRFRFKKELKKILIYFSFQGTGILTHHIR